MNFTLTKSFQKKVKKVCEKDPELRAQFAKQFSLFQQNHRHPSLKLHKLQGKRSEQCAIWIVGDLRALGVKSDDGYVFFDLVRHDQY